MPDAAPGDAWLAPFLAVLRAADGPVCELGCGPGEDAAWLTAHGLSVIGCDYSTQQLARARAAAPGAAFLRADIAAPLPLRRSACGAAVASLSLHYFPWAQTRAIVREIARVLRPDAPLVFRVNATDDVLHGAGAGEEVEPGLFRVPGPSWSRAGLKRFFDAAGVRAMLADDFAVAHLLHRTIDRYTAPKQVWECVGVKVASNE